MYYQQVKHYMHMFGREQVEVLFYDEFYENPGQALRNVFTFLEVAEFELDEGVRVYRIRSSLSLMPFLFKDNGRQYAPPFPDPVVMWNLRRIIAHEQPEIVHAHNWLVYSFLPLKARSRAKLIVTLHDYNLICVKSTLLYHGSHCDGPVFHKCLNCASDYYGLAKGVSTVFANTVTSQILRGEVDTFLPVSQAVAIGNGLVGSGLPFQVVHNFIPDTIALPRDDVDIERYQTQLPEENYLLFVGALNRRKGVDVLLRAYAGLTNAPPLVLIGYDSPEWATLSKDLPANVFVFKNWSRNAVMEAFRRSMVAFLPSVGHESCPTSVMEAMASGRPVIASRIGGLADLVDDGAQEL